MRKYLILILVLSIIFNSKIHAIGETKNDLLARLEGTWVNENYLNNLKELRAPIKAINKIGYPVFYIRKDKNQYVFNAVVEFHQGIGWIITDLIRLSKEKFYEFKLDNGRTIQFNVIDENQVKINRISIIDKDNKTIFVRIYDKEQEIQEYVNNMILAGEYKDSSGKLYRFKNNNIAQWPNRTFEYRLNLDPVFNQFDYFETKEKQSEIFGFEFVEGDLYIFKTKSRVNTEGLDKETKPFLILRPVKTLLQTRPDNILISEYAEYFHRYPGGKELTETEQNVEIAEANSLLEEGFSLYKAHNDITAISKYEEALKHYASAEIYYRYGNSLSNIPRLEDAIKAYKVAIELNYDKPYLVFYNIACVYSKMQNSKDAFANLELAIKNGYKNFSYIENDTDLTWLHSQPEWKDWWAKHKQ
jgi:hypothetical protein